MCAHHNRKKFWFNTPFLYAAMILLGLLSGFYDIPVLKTLGLFIADVFIRIFKCISLPIIALSIIVTLSSFCTNDKKMHTVWRRAMVYTLSTTLVAAFVSFILYLIISPAMVHKTASLANQNANLNQISYAEHLAKLIPESILDPFINHQVISVLLLSLAIGIAIRFIKDDEARNTISHFFKGAHGLFMVMTSWVIAIIPLGLFGFMTTTVAQLKGGAELKGIGQYLLIIVLANLIQGFVVLPLWLKLQKINPFTTFKGMLPALSVAFFSKSSVGTLPVTMETAEKNLHVRPEISRFVLPLCTSLNMNGCAAFIFTTVVYLMQNHGIELSIGTMLVWVFIATIAAIGNAGVPMGCFFLSASLLSSMNVPITLLMGVILTFYSLIDMLETALNVWSDSCVAKVVDEKFSHDLASETELAETMPVQSA